MRKHLLLLPLLFWGMAVAAQQVKTVSATYTYHAPKNISMEEAERIALERAKTEAIANEFGTIVYQSNTTETYSSGDKTKLEFKSRGGSEVKGEWIETIGEPKYDTYIDNEVLVVVCTVKGKAREIRNAQVKFDAHPLCNGTNPRRFESFNFKDGDDLYFYFKTPQSGYLQIYMLDEPFDTVYRLLPYRTQEFGSYPVTANEEYIFFSRAEAPKSDLMTVNEYVMECDREKEFQTIYILFSPTEIVGQPGMAIKEWDLPGSVSYEKFRKWLSDQLMKNNSLQFEPYVITIEK